MNWGQYEISIYIKKPGNESQPGLCASGWRDLHYHFRDIRSEYFVGGVWSKITDKFLVGAGSTYTLGATGGEATHTLNTDELPSHTHGNKSLTGYLDTYAWGDGVSSGIISKGTNAKNMTMSGGSTIGYIRYTTNASHEHNSVGQGSAHNNLPPYQAVYMWQRTA